MKNTIFFLLFLLGARSAFAQNAWTSRALYGGYGKADAVGFSIEHTGYIGTGSTLSYGNTKDFWAWDQLTNTWTQVADFGGGWRISAVGFSIDGKGYVGTGYGAAGQVADFWQYDPGTNIWTRKADFGGGPRTNATGFSTESPKAGYIYSGAHASLTPNDLWQYDPQSDTWVQKSGIPGISGRSDAFGFSIGNKGYVGAGTEPVNQLYFRDDFWEYNPVTDSWTQLDSIPAQGRREGLGFSIGNKGYAGTGYTASYPYNLSDFWEYDPTANTWTQKANVGGAPRKSAVGFSIWGRGYIGTGDMMLNTFVMQDFWEYTSAIDAGIDDKTVSSLRIFPNPAVDYISVSDDRQSLKGVLIEIFDAEGNLVMKNKNTRSDEITIDVHALSPGIYFVSATTESWSVKQKFVMQ